MRGTAMGTAGPGHLVLVEDSARRSGRRRPAAALVVGFAACALALSACSLHISKNGISGNIDGHKFAAEKGVLPPGFPSAVPSPDNSTVVVGVMGGASNGSGFEVTFGVPGTLSSVTSAYEAKLQAAGFTISNVQNPTSTSTGSSSPSTTDITASTFTATSSQWTVYVVPAVSSSYGGTLPKGDVAVNIVVASASLTTTTS